MIESETEIAVIIGLPIVLADVHLVPSVTERSVVCINNFTLRSCHCHNQSINLNDLTENFLLIVFGYLFQQYPSIHT